MVCFLSGFPLLVVVRWWGCWFTGFGFVVWGDCLLANYLGYWLIVLCLEILYF